jgi:hypothetical protein
VPAARGQQRRAAYPHRRPVNLDGGTVRLGARPHPVPLDPLSLDALQDCLSWRERLDTATLNVLITKRHRLHQHPCFSAFSLRTLADAA